VSEVTVTRSRHPLAGRRLQVIGAMRKLGRDELLVVLPDGSKTLMPSAWTDHDTTTAAGRGRESAAGTAVLAVPADLLRACLLVSVLRARAGAGLEQAARKSPCEEDDHAACPAKSDAGTDPGATSRSARVTAGGTGSRRDQGPGPADRPGRRGDGDGSLR
jgi:hypothetical protein